MEEGRKARHGTAGAELQIKTSKAAQIEDANVSAAIRRVAGDAIGTTAPRIQHWAAVSGDGERDVPLKRLPPGPDMRTEDATSSDPR
jgi:hypothetical protein